MLAQDFVPSTNPAPDVRHLPSTQLVDLSQFQWPIWTLQLKNHLARLPHHMHLWRPVIIGIDDDPELVESINGGHST
jgi:hypothetical protein